MSTPTDDPAEVCDTCLPPASSHEPQLRLKLRMLPTPDRGILAADQTCALLLLLSRADEMLLWVPHAGIKLYIGHRNSPW